MNLWRRLLCSLFHGKHHILTPWGIHHYFAECRRCGRQWDVSE